MGGKNGANMANSGEKIDMLHASLRHLSEDVRFNFGPMRQDWGRVGGEKYNILLVQFCRTIRELAKSCCVRWYGGRYWLFTGRCYEDIDVSVVEQSYQLLLEDLFIVPMLGKPSVRRDNFVSVIRQYNLLVPRRDLVAFSNGVVDFSSKSPVLMPFSETHHVVRERPYPYNPIASCPKWEAFLSEVLPDVSSREILQMYLGLGISGRLSNAPKLELCLLLVGSGSNGKSVIYDVMCGIFGSDMISKMDYADLTAEGDEGMRGRFPIRDAIFNWSSDSDSRKFGRRNTGMFKRLVSGEAVPVRELGHNVSEVSTLPYLIFNFNELPFPEDASLGFIRRLQYVSFDVVIPPSRQNPDLASEIIEEEASGVLNWLYSGVLKLRDRKYVFPRSAGSERQLLLSMLSGRPVACWVRAHGLSGDPRTDSESFEWVPTTELYVLFSSFCEANDIECPTSNSFGRAMSGLRFAKRRMSGSYHYRVYGDVKSLSSPVVVSSFGVC